MDIKETELEYRFRWLRIMYKRGLMKTEIYLRGSIKHWNFLPSCTIKDSAVNLLLTFN